MHLAISDPQLAPHRPASRLPDALIALASIQGGAISGSQLRQFLSPGDLDRYARAGAISKQCRNSYVLGRPDLHAALAAVDQRWGRPAVACLHTAASLYGFDIAGDGRLHILGDSDHASQVPGLRVHRFSTYQDFSWVRGRAATGAAETAIRIAAQMPDNMRALGVLDAALRSGSTSAAELLRFCGPAGLRGIRKVRDVAHLADPRAESPPESWLRYACFAAGLPAPTPQLVVIGPDGRRYRLDLGWEEYKIGFEYDGVEFHTGAALAVDRRRNNVFTSLGWTMFSMTGVSFWTERDAVMEMIRRQMRRAVR
ncbi:hypothetical protein EH165_00400 [Nakamurella antarctica]|uniref:Transcriptional regulator, AbiEi antitoxin, Type IV TA system n=1 Tax=Nakamurella antarctica TaxID=1902245 RepID=A0A3G8ZHZ6_9ACTN|nr:hypothetical protein [Nakamurella antarctica]AZI56858.1 hypothetical protein EH165_00400 [Nakamurella antarctica]